MNITLLSILLSVLGQLAGPDVYLPETRYFGREQGLSNLYVRDIVCDSEGEIWVATRDGLNRFDGYSFTTYRTDPDNPWSISCNVIECLEVGTDGKIWIGTDTSLSCYDPVLRRFFNYSLPSGHVLDIVQLDESNLFVRNGNNGLIFDIQRSAFKYEYGPVKIPDYKRLTLLKDSDVIYCSTSDRIEVLRPDSLEFLASLKGPVRKVVHIGDSLWLCKNDATLHIYDMSDSALSEFRDGGFFSKTRDICSYRGALFFATGIGLVRMAHDGSFNMTSVFPSDNPDYHLPVNTLLKDDQGGLWVTSFHDGVTRIGSSLPSESFSPVPVITGISLNGEEILPSKTGVIEKDVRYLPGIHLKGKVSELKIIFSVVNQSSCGNNTFRYRLEGYEKNWHEQDNRFPAMYKDLNPGKYSFVLYSANDRGVLSDEPKVFFVSISRKMPVVPILLSVFLTGGIILFRSRRKRKRTVRLKSSFEGVEYVIEGINPSNLSPEMEEMLKRIVSLVEKNLSDREYSSPHLARDLGMSRSVMYNRVSEVLGMGVGKLVFTIRMNIARHLISSGECSIDEAAEKTGFSSTSYFSSCFKKQFGKTPRYFLPVVAALLFMAAPLDASDSYSAVFRKIDLPDILNQTSPVSSICQDSFGFLWLTDGKSIVRYDGHNFISIPFEGRSGDGIHINKIVCDQADRLWALTSEGAWEYDMAESAFKDILNIHKATVFGLADIGKERVLVASSIGTRVCDLSDNSTVVSLFPRKDMKFISMGTLGESVILLGKDGGLFRWDRDTNHLDFLADAGDGATEIRPVLDNLVWVKYEDGRNVLLKIENNNTLEVPDETDPLFFLRDGKDDPVKYIDRNGGRWCVSDSGELYYSSPDNSLLAFFPGKDGKNIFASTVVSCVSVGRDGMVWIGRPGDGTIICYDQAERTVSSYKGEGAYETKSIVPVDGKTLVGYYSGGLQIIDCKSGKTHPVSGLNCVRCILPWKDGRFFVTTNGELFSFDIGSESLSRIEPEGWRSNYIKQLCLTSTDSLWVASERGLQLFSLSGEGWKECTDTDLSALRRATDITEGQDGRVWITTEYGLWVYDSRTREIGEYKDQSGILTGKVLYSIKDGGRGVLWMSGSDGLFSLDTSNGYSKRYDGIETLTCSQYNSGASAVCPDGKILFAGVGGITVLSPDEVYGIASSSRPVVTGIWYGDEKVPLSEDEIQLTHKKHASLSVSIVFPDISSVGLYSIAYRLDDGPEKILSGNPSTISLDRMKCGRHSLRYYPLNIAGDWKGDECCMMIRVGRNKYLTLLVLVPLVIVIGVLVSVVRKKRKQGFGRSDFMVAARNVVERNMEDKDFSVNEFASAMGISKTALYSKIEEYGGTTPSIFIRDTRIQVARDLLLSTDLSVSEIGEKVGFSSSSYFVFVFRKVSGMTPLVYRQQSTSRT